MNYLEFPNILAILDFRNAESYLAKQVSKASWSATLVNMVMATLILSATMLIIGLIGIEFFHTALTIVWKTVDVWSYWGGFTVIVIALMFTSLIMGVIFHLIAKAFGGKGTLVQLIYVLSTCIFAVSFLLAVLLIVVFLVNYYINPRSLIPSSKQYLLELGVLDLGSISVLYMYYFSIKVAHNLGKGSLFLTLMRYVMAFTIVIIVCLSLIVYAIFSISCPFPCII